jgi:hypothetical protein
MRVTDGRPHEQVPMFGYTAAGIAEGTLKADRRMSGAQPRVDVGGIDLGGAELNMFAAGLTSKLRMSSQPELGVSWQAQLNHEFQR